MAFQVSPGVVTKERDLTTIVPAVSTTVAAFAGHFEWGPVDERITVDSENELVSLFGEPKANSNNGSNYEEWFTAANYLGYGNNLKVVRSLDVSNAKNAASSTGTLVKNYDHYASVTPTAGDKWIARYAGNKGNSLKVVWHDGGNGLTYDVQAVSVGHTFDNFTVGVTLAQGSFGAGAAGASANIAAATWYGQAYAVGSGGTSIEVKTTSGTIGTGVIYETQTQQAGVSWSLSGATGTITGITNSLAVSEADYKNWKYADEFQFNMPYTTQWFEDKTGSTTGYDGVNIAVIDEDGEFTGTKGTVVEAFNAVSKASNAKTYNGDSNYYKDVIKETSRYLFQGEGPTLADGTVNTCVTGGSAWGTEVTTSGLTFAVLNAAGSTVGYADSLTGGTGEWSGTLSTGGTQGWGLFEDAETVDISLLLGGPASPTLAGSLVDLCDSRKDCVVFLSPEKADVIGNDTPRIESSCETNVLDYRNSQLNKSSSYAFLDSGWKYMYDRYNDAYRWVPLNGDIAGLAVRSDEQTETWFSPAGFNRGQIRGVIKLSWNPRQSNRDELYKEQVNPVVSFPGEGTVLFGDKTLQAKPSAFDRLNVRRLFIVLEKAISTAAKYQLFEQNDDFTRSHFKNMIEPFLRDVRARRGVTDFKVVCDETNNTSSVIDRNEFVADIYIKPTRSINFITLNFVATKTGVNFSEVGAGSSTAGQR